MNGQVTVTSERGNVRTRQIQQGPGTETKNPDLQGVYINNNTINVAVLDALLFNFLDFLKQLVGDPGYLCAICFQRLREYCLQVQCHEIPPNGID